MDRHAALAMTVKVCHGEQGSAIHGSLSRHCERSAAIHLSDRAHSLTRPKPSLRSFNCFQYNQLQADRQLRFTAHLDELRGCNCFIVTVPTPIDEHKRPDLTHDSIIMAVAHYQFKTMGAPAIRAMGKANHVLYGLKYLLPAQEGDLRL